jgi:hypothetical protein
MIDFLIAVAYVALIFTPAVVASIQQIRSHEGDF